MGRGQVYAEEAGCTSQMSVWWWHGSWSAWAGLAVRLAASSCWSVAGTTARVGFERCANPQPHGNSGSDWDTLDNRSFVFRFSYFYSLSSSVFLSFLPSSSPTQSRLLRWISFCFERHFLRPLSSTSFLCVSSILSTLFSVFPLFRNFTYYIYALIPFFYRFVLSRYSESMITGKESLVSLYQHNA